MESQISKNTWGAGVTSASDAPNNPAEGLKNVRVHLCIYPGRGAPLGFTASRLELVCGIEGRHGYVEDAQVADGPVDAARWNHHRGQGLEWVGDPVRL